MTQRRAVIVTGASSGIGSVIAPLLAEAGFDLFLVGRSAKGLQATAEAASRHDVAVQTQVLDIAVPDLLPNYVRKVGKSHPYLFALVNNAGVAYVESIMLGDTAHWREMLDVNYIAPMTACLAAVEVMRANKKPARIVNIGSIAAGLPATGAYGASKAAFELATSSLRGELQNDDIRVTTIVPGMFITQLNRHVTPESQAKLVAHAQSKGVQLGTEHTIGDPVHVARAVRYVLEQPVIIEIEKMIVRPPVEMDM